KRRYGRPSEGIRTIRPKTNVITPTVMSGVISTQSGPSRVWKYLTFRSRTKNAHASPRYDQSSRSSNASGGRRPATTTVISLMAIHGRCGALLRQVLTVAFDDPRTDKRRKRLRDEVVGKGVRCAAETEVRQRHR